MCNLAKCFFTLLLLLLGTAGYAEAQDFPQAQNGQIDLSHWQPTHSELTPLTGKWDAIWGTLVEPGQFPEKAEQSTLPSLWADSENNSQNYGSFDQASYHLRVFLPPQSSRELALLIKGPLSVVAVFIDGKKVGTSGTVGQSTTNELPVKHLIHPKFTPDKGSFDITLHVSNYHNVKGGLNIPILLGTTEQVELHLKRQWITGSLLGGVLCITGIAHLLLFTVLKGKRANLYFGVFCLFWALLTMAGETWGFLLANLIPSLPWSATIYFSLVPYGFSIPLIVMFYHALFPKKYGKPVELFYCSTGLVYLLYLAFTPANAYGFGVMLYNMVASTIFPYLVFNLIVDIKNRETDARYLVPGYVFLGLTGIADRLIDLQLYDLSFLIPFGSTGFILCYSVVIVLRFSRSYKEIGRLTSDLATTREELKDKDLSLHSLLTQVEETEEQEKKENIRNQAVTVMNLSMAHWKEVTGRGKREFARKSGIWKVYTDRNGWQRTQTLDKYLNTNTIPNNPRFSLVIKTGDFVSEQGNSSLKDELVRELTKLKKLI